MNFKLIIFDFSFVYTDHVQPLLKLSRNERMQTLAQALFRASGLRDFLSPREFVEKHWQDEDCARFNANCCVWSLPSGVLTSTKSWPSQSHGDVMFASSEFALTFRGYMDGALRSSERAVHLVSASFSCAIQRRHV